MSWKHGVGSLSRFDPRRFIIVGPDRKTKPYHPGHFPDPDDPDSVGGFVVAANNDEYAFYHSGTSQDAAVLNASAKPSCPHCGMAKDASRIQDFLNLLSFKPSCPANALKKAEALLKTMLEGKEILRFRAEFPMNSEF